MKKNERIEALEAKVATLERELAALRNSIAVVPYLPQFPPNPWQGIIPPAMFPLPMAPHLGPSRN